MRRPPPAALYRSVLSRSDLEEPFFVDDADKQLIAKRRGAHSRLGLACR
jgi:hypothetical protein